MPQYSMSIVDDQYIQNAWLAIQKACEKTACLEGKGHEAYKLCSKAREIMESVYKV